jgi:aminomethyltransferase
MQRIHSTLKTWKKQKEEGVTRKLVAFEMQERSVPRHDYEIVDAGTAIE